MQNTIKEKVESLFPEEKEYSDRISEPSKIRNHNEIGYNLAVRECKALVPEILKVVRDILEEKKKEVLDKAFLSLKIKIDSHKIDEDAGKLDILDELLTLLSTPNQEL